MHLRIALAQMRSEKADWAGNLQRVEHYMAAAATQRCGIIIFPEMSLSGYNDPTFYPDSVQPLESGWVSQFIALTARYRIIASAGFIETNPTGGKPYITQLLAQSGRLLGSYRKRHVVGEEADWFSPGDTTSIFHLNLPGGTIPVALAICADSDNPQVFADAAHCGARLVLHSSAPGLCGRRTTPAEWQDGFDWYTQHLAHCLPNCARSYGLYIAVATQTGSTVDEDFPGGSFIFAPNGDCILASPDYNEMLLTHDLDIL